MSDHEMIDRLLGPSEPELSCEECFEHLDEYVEGADVDRDMRETLARITSSIRDDLTPHQRAVLLALAVDGVPIDVLAERRGTTRGALYKTLHDARRRLRAALADQELGATP